MIWAINLRRLPAGSLHPGGGFGAPCASGATSGRAAHYAAYRRLGLPITSSHIESTIKQINRRLKGTETFWDQGAEPLTVLAADYVSETNRLDCFWRNRRRRLRTTRCYQTAA